MSYWEGRELAQTCATDEDLLQAISRISTYASEAKYVWRGQPKLDWTLNPGLVRRLQDHGRWHGPITESQLRGHEMQLLDSARATGYGRDIRDVELLALLQHHGAATRLLDVSSEPMVAMWFAVENKSLMKTDGALFAINISNAKAIERTEKRAWNEILDSMKTEEIGFYDPAGADERIKVQRGRFVFSKLTGREPRELSLPIDTTDWSEGRREKFFDQAPRGSGRPRPPAILVLKIPGRIKPRLLRLLEDSYGYTPEAMFPDLSGFAAANGWQKPLRRDRRPAVELTDSFLPVAMKLPKGTSSETSFKEWSDTELLRAAQRDLSISVKRVMRWLKEPTVAPQYWAAYHADEVVGVFKIDKRSWRPSGAGRYTCELSVTDSTAALAVLGCSFLYKGEPMRLSGRAVFVNHTRPHV